MYTPQFLTLIGKLNNCLTDLRINTLLYQMLERDGEDTGWVDSRKNTLEHDKARLKMFLTYNFDEEYREYCNEIVEIVYDSEAQK